MENVLAVLIAQRDKYTNGILVQGEEKKIWQNKEELKKRAAEHAQKQLNQWISANKGLEQSAIAKRREELEKTHLNYFTDQAKSQIETCDGFIKEYKERENEFNSAIAKISGKKVVKKPADRK